MSTATTAVATPDPLDLLTPDDVCRLLHVTKDWLYDQVEKKKFPVVRLGRQLRFQRGAVQDHVDRLATQAHVDRLVTQP